MLLNILNLLLHYLLDLCYAYCLFLVAYPVLGMASLIGSAAFLVLVMHLITIHKPVDEEALADKLKHQHGYLDPHEVHFLKRQGNWPPGRKKAERDRELSQLKW
jgi:hypothetical protein